MVELREQKSRHVQPIAQLSLSLGRIERRTKPSELELIRDKATVNINQICFQRGGDNTLGYVERMARVACQLVPFSA